MAERVLTLPWLSWADFLALHRHARVSLDTWPFRGGSTTVDALFAGPGWSPQRPVLARPSKHRPAASGAWTRWRLTRRRSSSKRAIGRALTPSQIHGCTSRADRRIQCLYASGFLRRCSPPLPSSFRHCDGGPSARSLPTAFHEGCCLLSLAIASSSKSRLPGFFAWVLV